MNFQEGAYIYINKPYRMSSFGALAHIRYVLSKRLHVKRVKMGHAGTLDPLATGVLVLCTGKATKQIEALQLHSKEYTATLQLGATTPSYDLEHEVDATYPTAHITRELIEQTLPQFVGDIMQRPPLFSACKVGGDRAYELARQGSDHQLAEKPVHIDEIEIMILLLNQALVDDLREILHKSMIFFSMMNFLFCSLLLYHDKTFLNFSS
jgi:tRNA pseudouridine55 synthase